MSGGDAEVLLYLAPEAFEEVLVGPTRGVGYPGALTEDGLVLPAGLSAEPIAQEGAARLVVHETFGLLIEAWVPEARVGRWWLVEEVSPAPERRWGPLSVRGTAPLYDGPGGDPVAWVKPFDDERPDLAWFGVRPAGPEVGGYVPISVEDGDVTGVLWVAEDDLGGVEGGKGFGGQYSSRCGFYVPSHDPSLPTGSWLYDQPAGEIIGRTLRPLWVPDGGAWRAMRVHTRVGWLLVYADEDDLIGGRSSR